MSSKNRVLIIDDDVVMAKYLASHLSRRSFEVNVSSSSQEAMRIFRSFDPSLILLDMAVDNMAGADLLQRIKQIRPQVSVIVLSGNENPEIIFQASKLGADDYLSKPFDPKELDLRISKVLESQRLFGEVTQLRDQVRGRSDFTMLFGTSPKMEEVKNTIEQVADTTATVLIRGESGTGKEVVARMVYAQSARSDKPFVKVNCAAIPHELLESELFGYEPGAFTGANRQKLGKFDQANDGTIFLDEISEMHPALQAKLLHVLQDDEFSRLGGKRDISGGRAGARRHQQAAGAGRGRRRLPRRPVLPAERGHHPHSAAARAARRDSGLSGILPEQVQRFLLPSIRPRSAIMPSAA